MKQSPDIVATVELFTLGEGGRASPMPPRSFGCVMVVNGRNHDIRVRLEEPLAPGGSRQVGIDFLNAASVLAYLKVGVTFGLWEAGIIGQGTVDAIDLGTVETSVARASMTLTSLARSSTPQVGAGATDCVLLMLP